MEEGFEFGMGQTVTLALTEETGKVIARAEYAGETDKRYLILYKAADGRQTSEWWAGSAIK